MRPCILIVCVVALAVDAAQGASAAKAALEGSVIKEPGGEPLKKAIVELISENQEEGGNYTATSDQDGHFRIADIQPGRYKLFAERTGYIEVGNKRRRSEGRIVSLEAGQTLKEQTLKMLPAAIITGRALDEDGEPMPNVEITLLRRKSPSWEPSGSAQTNDLGEYRIGGLLAGKYYVVASPTPSFQSLVSAQKGSEDGVASPADTSYLATYYPGVVDRAQASPIELHAGTEMPVDFSLTRRHAPRIRGRVSGLAAGSKAVVMLRGKDANAVFNAAEVDKDGKFEIRNVAPGTYTLAAMTVLAETPQIVRQTIEVGSADIDDLHLAPLPLATIRGRVHFGGKIPIESASAFMVFLQAMEGDDDWSDGVTFSGDEAAGSSNLAKLKPDGSFELKNVLPGLYELAVSGDSKAGGDTFVESLAVGTKDYTDTGLNVSGGTISVDLTVSSAAGVIDGTVTSEKNEPVADSFVVAVPETKYRKQPYRYRKGSADQAGRFSLRGLRPGAYTIYAWESLDGDQYLDPEFLKSAEGRGTVIKVEKSSHQSIALKVIPAPSDQP